MAALPNRQSALPSRRYTRCAGIPATADQTSSIPEAAMNHTATAHFPKSATIREVGLRDGLQSIATVMPTETKKQWLKDAFDAGMREIEVGSFVPARLLPQLADTAEVLAYAKTL